MAKSPDAFRTISEVAEWLGVQAHVLRFWESKFTQVKPVKRAGGRRYYRPVDMQLLGGIKRLLHDDGMTIKGVQKMLREQGVAHVQSFSQGLDETAADDVVDGGTVIRFTDKQTTAKQVTSTQGDTPVEISTTATQIDLDLEAQPTRADPTPPVAPGASHSTQAGADQPSLEPTGSTESAASTDASLEDRSEEIESTVVPQQAPRPLIVDAPDPFEDAFQNAEPGLLSRMSALRVTPENRSDLAEVARKLRDWCDAQNNTQAG